MHVLDKRPRLVRDTQLTQQVAGVVVGHEARGSSADLRHAQNVHDEVGQLVGFLGNRLRAVEHLGVVSEKLYVVDLDHRRAGAGRHDDVLIGFEGLDEVTRDLGSLFAVAAVEADLPTACLILGERDIDAEVPQHLDGCHANLGEELVHEAGRTQSGLGPRRSSLRMSATASASCHGTQRSRRPSHAQLSVLRIS